MSRKLAFYPCCGTDFAAPLSVLADITDEVVFCDISEAAEREFGKLKADGGLPPGLLTSCFRREDARHVIEAALQIDVLFYRRDSNGEGGSSVFILGDSVLPSILKKFPSQSGLIITDGSNSRGRNFDRMIRKSGLSKYGFHFSLAAKQPFLATLHLHVIEVKREPTDQSRVVGD